MIVYRSELQEGNLVMSPPEDCGGPWGCDEMMGALSDEKHPEHEMYREWIPVGYDPARCELDKINEALATRSGSSATLTQAPQPPLLRRLLRLLVWDRSDERTVLASFALGGHRVAASRSMRAAESGGLSAFVRSRSNTCLQASTSAALVRCRAIGVFSM